MKHLLVLIELSDNRISPASLATVAFAQEFARATNIDYDFLVTNANTVPDSVQSYGAANAFHAAASIAPTPEEIADAGEQFMRSQKDTSLAGPATSSGINILARVAGKLDLPLVTHVRSIESGDGSPAFRCDFARNKSLLVRPIGGRAVFSIARTAFGRPQVSVGRSVVKSLRVNRVQETARQVGPDELLSRASDLQTARVIVAGGRALGDGVAFERLIGGLAEKLGGATAATGAAVQIGISQSGLLIGQTGQTVAPDLYTAAGLSGSDQHTAGFRDAKIVVAINSNPNAAIFRTADYGLVADVHQALPELIEKI